MHAQTQLQTDTALELLANHDRREILRLLIQVKKEAVDVADIAPILSRRHALDEAQLRILVQHRHLPMLDEANVVDFDRHAGTVQYRSHEKIETLLGYVSRIE